MPLDAICLSALVRELNTQVVGGRVDKVHQPARDEVILSVRTTEGSHRLLLSASPTRPRAQLTAIPRENPAEPPMFCMLLRKHLTGGRIQMVYQPSMERIVEFQIEATNEIGDLTVKRLILETMGRHSNLILLDQEGRIIDCIRKVDQDMSAQRQILPGMFYRSPPTQGKSNPLELTESMAMQRLSQISRERQMDKCLVDMFSGISPLIARELAFEVAGSTDALIGDNAEQLIVHLKTLLDNASNGLITPYMLIRDKKPVDFSFRPIFQYGPSTEIKQMDSFSALLDEFYAVKEANERVRQKGQELIRSVTTARDRISRKLGFQRQELGETKNRDQFRQLGDLITSNLFRMEKGMQEFKTVNYYDPEGTEITIQLDPMRTPQQNAARYYKDYHRAKTAEQVLTEQIEKGEQELSYLNSVLESLSRAEGERDLEEIRRELEECGYVRKRSKGKKQVKRPPSKPLEFRSSAGLRISVGRNNTQNDELTSKMAGRSDFWFHAQSIHGAHVILWTDGKEPDLQSMTEAAMLAAWFSQGREGSKIPVDYTRVKFVKKPSGARPGMVIYSTYETTYVTPEENVIKSLQVK